GFQVGPYNAGLALVIDPVLNYSTYVGGSGIDGGYGIAVDSTGNVYVAGITQSPDFPTVAGQQPQNAGDYDVFVSKIRPNGTLPYSTYLGGAAYDGATAIAIDGSGNAYVAGQTASANFPVTAAAAQAQFGGGISDAFVAKLSATGALSFATYLGGSSDDAA